MHQRSQRFLYLLSLCGTVAILAWPVFVAVATVLALFGGEARQLDAWILEPHDLLLTEFLVGWKASTIVAIPVGVVAAIDYLLLSRYRVTWIIGGVLIPTSCAIIASTQFNDTRHAMPTLVATGITLALIYRLIEALRHRTFGG